MPVPPEIATLVADPGFWTSLLGLERGDRAGAVWNSVPIVWSLPGDFALQLHLVGPGESSLWLDFPGEPDDADHFLQGTTKEVRALGSWKDGTQHHGLRFDEVDLVGRWLAVNDAAWVHPGLALALLQPYTPITSGDNAEVVSGMFWQAWQSLRVLSVQQILTSLERSDWRGTDVRWRERPSVGWTLTNGGDVFRGRRLHTRRHEANGAFPFTMLRTFEEELICALHAAIEPAWLERDNPVRDLATASLDDADPARWPILADALEEQGCALPGMLAAFHPPVDPVRALVMLEVLLAPLGVVPGQLLKGRLPPPPRLETERLEIWLPLDSRYTSADAEKFMDALRTDLFREDQGSVLRESLQYNELRLRVILRGELEPALQTLYRTCRLAGVPEGTRVACDSSARYSTVFWPDWFDLDFR